MPFADEMRPVAVVDHRAAWAAEFVAVARTLRRTLGGLAMSIDHVGSTSVPGLAAKDCIDIQVRVEVVDKGRLAPPLIAHGFRLRPEPWNRIEISSGVTLAKLVFAPAVGQRASNVHIRAQGGAGARFALLFRDYLRADEPARVAWGAFKRRLAQNVPDLLDYGQIKAPATEILMIGAERWAAGVGWSPPEPEG